MIGEVQPFAAARPLLEEIKERGFKLVLASSGKAKHVEALPRPDRRQDLADAWTTSDDVKSSKPSPDLVSAALDEGRGRARAAWSATRSGTAWPPASSHVPTVGVLTGGFSREELKEAGAVRVFDSLGAMLDEIDTTPFRRRSRTAA